MCNTCKTKPVYEFTNKRKLCKNCYIHWFEKKSLYIIRKFNMLKNGDVVTYSKTNDFRSVVLEDILKMIAEKGRINVIANKVSQIKITKFAIPTTIDMTADEILKSIIKKSVDLAETKPVHKKTIKPLYLFLDKEILIYAQLKKLKFKIPKERENKIAKFLDELERKHPEIKRAVVNSYLSVG